MFTPLFAATEEPAEGIAALGIDPIAILLHTGTFLILFFLIRKFALEKITTTLEDRRVTIEEGLENAEIAAKTKAETEETIAADLQKAEEKKQAILAEGNKEAGAIVSAAEAEAQTKANTILANAKAKVAAEKEAIAKELRAETVSLVTHATETVLREKLTSAKDKELIKKALKDAEAAA